jgi:hypothetical protein
MAQPGRNVDVLIVFPEGYQLRIDMFLANYENVDVNFGSTFTKITYKGWLLPENGVVWRLVAIPDIRPLMTGPAA